MEFGIVTSAISIAGVGAKLSVTLYSFAETVKTAKKNVEDIARDVSITSSVLNQLAAVLEEDKKANISKEAALKTADEALQECGRVYKEIDCILEKSMKNARLRPQNVAFLEKLKWPFIEPKMGLLRSNLEKLKSTLLLLLGVLNYARDVANRKLDDQDKALRREQIGDLNKSNTEYNRRHEELLKAIDSLTYTSKPKANTNSPLTRATNAPSAPHLTMAAIPSGERTLHSSASHRAQARPALDVIAQELKYCAMEVRCLLMLIDQAQYNFESAHYAFSDSKQSTSFAHSHVEMITDLTEQPLQHHYQKTRTFLDQKLLGDFNIFEMRYDDLPLQTIRLAAPKTWHLRNTSVFDTGAQAPPPQPVTARLEATKHGKPRKRLQKSCTNCRKRKIRCGPGDSGTPKCIQCDQSGRDCIYKGTNSPYIPSPLPDSNVSGLPPSNREASSSYSPYGKAQKKEARRECFEPYGEKSLVSELQGSHTGSNLSEDELDFRDLDSVSRFTSEVPGRPSVEIVDMLLARWTNVSDRL